MLISCRFVVPLSIRIFVITNSSSTLLMNILIIGSGMYVGGRGISGYDEL